MSDVIEFKIDGAVGVLTINNPPANALSFAVVKGIEETVASCMEDTDCMAIVITGAGRMFVAGADIREFNMTRPNNVPEFHDLIKRLEDSPKPIVAAINGIAFGGGLELAMGCHYRLISPGALVGQPEVKLGIIPGAGGTQRLPRLIGVEAALKMIVGGEPIIAAKALELGVVDELVQDDLVIRAISFAEEKAPDQTRPTSTLTDRLGNVKPNLFDDYRATIAGKSRGMDAPFECINAVEVSATKPFEEDRVPGKGRTLRERRGQMPREI